MKLTSHHKWKHFSRWSSLQSFIFVRASHWQIRCPFALSGLLAQLRSLVLGFLHRLKAEGFCTQRVQHSVEETALPQDLVAQQCKQVQTLKVSSLEYYDLYGRANHWYTLDLLDLMGRHLFSTQSIHTNEIQ